MSDAPFVDLQPSAEPSIDVPRVICHRVRFSEKKADLLRSAGVMIVNTGSVNQTLAEIAVLTSGLVIVDVSVGSAAPEKILSAVIARRAIHPAVDALPCVAGNASRARRRLEQVGFERAWVWDEGVFAELGSRLKVIPTASFKRAAPRAAAKNVLSRTDSSLGFTAKLVNISASGALVEITSPSEPSAPFAVELRVGRHTVTLHAEIMWCSRAEATWHVGVRWVDPPPAAQAHITRFVERQNVLESARDTGVDGRASQLPLTRVRVRHGTRSDWFRYTGNQDQGQLIPAAAFAVPYRPGDEVTFEVPRPGGGRAIWRMVIVRPTGSALNLGGPVSWFVRRADLATEEVQRDAAVQTIDAVTGTRPAPTPGAQQPPPRELEGDDPLKSNPRNDVFSVDELARLLRAHPDALTERHLPRWVMVGAGAVGATNATRTLAHFVPVAEVQAPKPLLLLPGDIGYALTRASVEAGANVGRSEKCDIRILSESISRTHANLKALPNGHLQLTDLGSSNGTFVFIGGKRKRVRRDEKAELASGDQIQLGNLKLTVLDREALLLAVRAALQAAPARAGDAGLGTKR